MYSLPLSSILPRFQSRLYSRLPPIQPNVLVIPTAGILLPRPQTRHCNLLEPRFHAPFIKPGVESLLDKLGDLRDILQAGAGADEGADGEVEAVVVEEGECEGCGGGRWGGGGDE